MVAIDWVQPRCSQWDLVHRSTLCWSISVERGVIVMAEEGIENLELADRERRGTAESWLSLGEN